MDAIGKLIQRAFAGMAIEDLDVEDFRVLAEARAVGDMEVIDVEVSEDGAVVSAEVRGDIPIKQGPDGEAHQERSAVEDLARTAQRLLEAKEALRSERRRFLRLGQTVLDGCRAIFETLCEEADWPDAGHEVFVLERVRVLAGAIGEGNLVRTITRELERHGAKGYTEQEVEYLARRILDRQIEAGEARVTWESRSQSRDRRRASARAILQVVRMGEALDSLPPGTEGMVAAAAGALIAELRLDPRAAERIARHAVSVLASADGPPARNGAVEAARTAERA